MEKHLSRILLILILCVSLCAGLLALGAADPAAAPVYTVDEPYVYPVVPGTDEWRELNGLPDMIAACHVDVDLMESMTTPALLETVLTYPLLGNVFAFNTPEGGFASVSRYFEGLELLAAREDAAECLLEFAGDPEKVARVCEYESLRILYIHAVAWYLGMSAEELLPITQPDAVATQPTSTTSAGKAISIGSTVSTPLCI